jgi:hypothetical protein
MEAARMWNALGRRSAVTLIVVGALLTAEAVISQRHRLAWWVLAAGAIMVGAIRLRQTWSGWPSGDEIARLGRQWRPFLVAASVYFAAFLVMAPLATGDQPHYELESIGLAYDQTRDMTLNYTLPDRRNLVYRSDLRLESHAYRYKRGGELVLGHNVGLGLALTPAVPWVEAAHSASPTKERWPWSIEIIIFAALAAQLLYRILTRLRPHHPAIVAGVWASVVFSAPVVVYASQVYPEIPAVLLALIAVDALMRPPTRRAIVSGAAATALLPWLHQRFLPIAALLALGLAIRALAALPLEQRRTAAGVRRAAWAIVPLVVSVVVMAIAFQRWYGSPLPNAPWRVRQVRLPYTLSASWEALAGAFWSAQRGWLPFAPIGILALASIGYTVRRYGVWALYGLAVAATYVLSFTVTGARPGFSFAGRYELILMPFVALPLLIAVADLAPVRWVFWPLAVFTLYLTLAIVFEPPGPVTGFTVPVPIHPVLLWQWFVNIWPGIIASARHPYPGVSSAFAWSLAVLAVSVAGYFVLPREPGAPRARRSLPRLPQSGQVEIG